MQRKPRQPVCTGIQIFYSAYVGTALSLESHT
nr:MAG TPA: hypothetical protein [Caudoviricetes sp.]